MFLELLLIALFMAAPSQRIASSSAFVKISNSFLVPGLGLIIIRSCLLKNSSVGIIGVGGKTAFKITT